LGPNLLSNNRLLSRVHGIDIETLFSLSEPITKEHWNSIEGGKKPIPITNPSLKRKRKFIENGKETEEEEEERADFNDDYNGDEVNIEKEKQQKLFDFSPNNTSSESDLMYD